jgi:hypothetical protein
MTEAPSETAAVSDRIDRRIHTDVRERVGFIVLKGLAQPGAQ